MASEEKGDQLLMKINERLLLYSNGGVGLMEFARRSLLKGIIILCVIFNLSGCGGATAASGNKQANSEVPKIAQLLIGIIKLDGTAQAVTQSQASELLFLWKAYQRLTKEETTAAEELNGLQEQIQEQLNDNQIQSIEKMKISFKDIAETLQKEGIVTNNKRTGTNNSSSGGVGMPPPDAVVLGGPPGGGMNIGGSRSAGTAKNGQGGTRNISGGLDARLFEVIIRYLEKKAGIADG